MIRSMILSSSERVEDGGVKVQIQHEKIGASSLIASNHVWGNWKAEVELVGIVDREEEEVVVVVVVWACVTEWEDAICHLDNDLVSCSFSLIDEEGGVTEDIEALEADCRSPLYVDNVMNLWEIYEEEGWWEEGANKSLSKEAEGRG